MRRVNPKKLNALQLRTLAILQGLASDDRFAEAPDAEGAVTLRSLPHAHGDHFHVGDGVVLVRDATGLFNPAVHRALVRKHLLRADAAGPPTLTAEGLAYDTGIADTILHRSDHA
ncbi:MAG: hypothetical protein KDE35_15485 [Geminicoccaceae bacterium]|nr:hypothetical protein [Geminicoccaceae bacterium]